MDEIIDQIWKFLDAGAHAGRERSPFTMLQAATIGVDGAPMVRTIVLRRACRDERSVMFHTDVRSKKVAELRRDSRISLLGCDLEAGIQIRLQGIARIVQDPKETAAVWNASRPRTLIVYRAPLIPGTPVDAPAEAYVTTDAGQEEQSAGFENFCLVEVSVSKIDYLNLYPSGHVRASLAFNEGKWAGSWIAP